MDNSDQKGLYVPQLEKDSCGVGLFANLNGDKVHRVVDQALTMLENMEHRGACGCEPETGDGAGILVQTPDRFFTKVCRDLGFTLPAFGQYGVLMCFLPKDDQLFNKTMDQARRLIAHSHFHILGQRDVPVNNFGLGKSALSTEPRMVQLFVAPNAPLLVRELERQLYVLRKYIIHSVYKILPEVEDSFYISSSSYKTIIYKGQLTTHQLRSYFPDLQHADFASAIAIIHSRFSTNTVPKWKLAQPFRYIAHNGEINTIMGNLNWWRAKEDHLQSEIFTAEDNLMLKPIPWRGLSDSGSFDNVLEYLVQSGRSVPHSLMMMIPEAWEHDEQMAQYKKDFYAYHQNLMEPWDGPASMCFSDGIVVGATLDRNGLRPSRYSLTEDNELVVASETGVVDLDQAKIILKGRLQPGRILIADLDQHRIVGDEEVKKVVCQNKPYGDWLARRRKRIEDLGKPMPFEPLSAKGPSLVERQQWAGMTKEDLKVILQPMVMEERDPLGSMGTDTPLAALSDKPQHLGNYFKQLFAQVTNPPIDSLRERSVMAFTSRLGASGNILEADESLAAFIYMEHPVMTHSEMNLLKSVSNPDFKLCTLSTTFALTGPFSLENAVKALCHLAEVKVREGFNILVLSDADIVQGKAAIPSLMATGAIHHHLIQTALRSKTSLVVQAADIWESHHFALLFGYGANAIHPYLALETVWFREQETLPEDYKTIEKKFIKGLEKSLLKIMAKNGISTLQSYQGAQIFEAVGIHDSVIETCFRGTVSRIGGLNFEGIQKEIGLRYQIQPKGELRDAGIYQWKRNGEFHLFNPQSIHLLQMSTQLNDYSTFKKYSKVIDDQDQQACTLRGLFHFKKGNPIPIEEVEPIENILKRFSTGAMSFGSISYEAHTTLAIAMNRIGAKSNSGEGGEDPKRYLIQENGDYLRSAIKQVASGRFGATSYYLSEADELQIKMAQGAKPGEGGELPGHKVNDWIGRVRHSTPGVGLISPPPHHDIYSIEDLAQLIFDLKNANRNARISVKLVSKAGVGIIASGVAKAHADVILISGHDGGTGASPLTSIRHAGLPWELGLAESHQTLLKNKLRDRVILQCDGQLRSGKDLVTATLLGAEEWGIATAALVVEGCILMRKCHLNTCPVGIATQDPELRKKFHGKPEHVISFFTFLAREMREIMASLGFRTINEMVGRTDLLEWKPNQTWKTQYLDLDPILQYQAPEEGTGTFKSVPQDHGIDDILDRKLIEHAKPALESGQHITGIFNIKNTDRATGTMLSYEISRKWHGEGLPPATIRYRFRGSAGQSFAAFGARGLHFILEGESNDYFGKGLSGATLVVSPDRKNKFDPSANIIVGNVALYGATSGEVYIKGMAGERFAVRNSGASAVVEGVGDHGCEYMTGGRVLILGKVGKNFAAGMSGGIAYVKSTWENLDKWCNKEMVELEPPAEEDFEEIRKLLRNHFHYTSSRIALDLLENWELKKDEFIKVMPVDYKRVLLEKKKQIAEFVTVDK
ncbi:MAG TPA: glutamate synthase large subunit [Saprospiraceae bacterium]|nr:glutamate synthase large subunit [Saprospiraceae bacterium]HNT20185.1 glutamate synthase large subunit [Saprospiraceae bacterium]